ncbi:MAG: pyruvate kinase [Bacillota bacterium]
MAQRRRTKIVCTVGPSCESEDVLHQMILAGMDVARFNFSHGTHEEQGKRIETVRLAAARAGKRVGIMLDTRGPEIRVGTFAEGRAFLKKDSTFILTTTDQVGDSSIAHVNMPDLPSIVAPGQAILVDDGNITLTVVDVTDDAVVTRVQSPGVISNRKKVSVPGCNLNMPIVNTQDISDLRFGASVGVDFVAASFVRSGEDVAEIRRVLADAGSQARVIAKIECVRGVDNLDEIIEAADGLMVARGDLGVEFPPEEIPILQKRMIAGCMRAGKPVITATQMLESMVEHPRPTRAEASDVANAIFDGTDAVMLSAETASGQYPVQSVEFMSRIARRAEEALDRRVFLPHLQTAGRISSVTEAVSRSVMDAAEDLSASAIVTPTESGYTARMVARFRPEMPIYAVTPHDETAGWLTLVWGVETLVIPTQGSGVSDFSGGVLDALRERQMVKPGDLCVITRGVPAGVKGTTNVMEVRSV